MARLIFKERQEFIDYMARFSGTGRMMLLDVAEDNSLILRPTVTSRGVDTAEILEVDAEAKKNIKDKFDGQKYSVRRVVWREEEPPPRT